jgi:hypothetical protein
MKVQGTLGLLQAFGSVRVYAAPQPAAGRRLFAVVHPCAQGAAYNARVVDEDGRVYVELEGYQTIAFGGMNLPG